MAGIYVHVPFCRSKCAYCDFYSMPQKDFAEAYTDAVVNEWQHRRNELDEAVTTLYFGGGTPSSLDGRLLDRIVSEFPLTDILEATIEVNPEDVTPDFCRWLRTSPFRRVSMGVQSLDDSELRTVGRRHTSLDALHAVERLREHGVENLSLDLIYGLPGQSLDSWQQSLDCLLTLHPEHLSAYLLSYEPGTRLSAMLAAGKIAETDEETARAMYDTLCRMTEAAGYSHYEISNFALPGKESRHNSSYWTMTPYIGLGPAAHSFTKETRRYNPSDLRSYISTRGLVTVIDTETATQRDNDRIITALRTAGGLDLAYLPPDRTERLKRSAAKWVNSGVLAYDGARIRMDESHWLICDRVLLDLIEIDED